MAVRPPYKQTELGVIPEDWSIATVGELSDVKTGPFGTALHERDYVSSGTPIVTVEHLGERGITHANLPLVSDADKHRLRAYSLRTGDIVFSRVGSVDRNALVGTPEDGWLFSGRLLRVRPKAEIHPRYLSHHFHSEGFKQRVRDVAVGQTMASINTQILKGVKSVLPRHRGEQEAIAEALSDADALIQLLEQLNTKKRQIKHGAMQDLLSGKKRLPGFSGEWTATTLDQVAFLQAGINKSVSYMGRGSLYVTVQDLYAGASIAVFNLGRIQVSPSEMAARSLLPHDIVFGKSSVKREGIGYPSQFLGADEPVVFSGFTYRARSKVGISDPTFLFHALRWERTRRWLIDNAQASALTNINRSIAENIPLTLPSLPEQVAIATVLSAMDTELAELETKVTKARQLKQGMMQMLLTGAIRLPRAETA